MHNPFSLALYGNDILVLLRTYRFLLQVAEKAVSVAKAWGCPIRWGKKGYNRPTHIRLAVRKAEFFQVILSAFKQELLPGETAAV